ncbi:MAG: SDR family oxidoreductase [Pseudomonadota bacterium]
MQKMLIIGCGDIGRRVARIALRRGDGVSALVRTTQSCAALRKLGIDAIQADLDRDIAPLDIEGAMLLYLAPPPRRGREDPRMHHLLQALTGTPEVFLYLGTTGVYGDCNGEWVDESRPVAPLADRAWRRLDAERQLADAAARHGWRHVIMRVAGIYGAGRLPLQRIRERRPVLRTGQAPYTNRIHQDDLAAITLALLDRGVSGEIYNVSDGHPGTMSDYFSTVARYAGLQPPPEIDSVQAEREMSAGMLSYLRESRRISNRKMMELPGIELRYPTLEDGLKAIFPQQNNNEASS